MHCILFYTCLYDYVSRYKKEINELQHELDTTNEKLSESLLLLRNKENEIIKLNTKLEMNKNVNDYQRYSSNNNSHHNSKKNASSPSITSRHIYDKDEDEHDRKLNEWDIERSNEKENINRNSRKSNRDDDMSSPIRSSKLSSFQYSVSSHSNTRSPILSSRYTSSSSSSTSSMTQRQQQPSTTVEDRLKRIQSTFAKIKESARI